MISYGSDLLVIQTGGTIDKVYPKKACAYGFEIGEPAVRSIVDRSGVQPKRVRITTVVTKDSQAIDDNDRKLIWDYCLSAFESAIVITHGTDTMIETARYLHGTLTEYRTAPGDSKLFSPCPASNVEGGRKHCSGCGHHLAKTIVVTGATQPAAMRDSDADFNVGFAFAAALISPPGVYVAMSGRVLAAESVTRDPKTLEFVDGQKLPA